MLPVQVGQTVSALLQAVLVLEAVVSVWNPEMLQLGQAEDVQHHLGLITCLQLRRHLRHMDRCVKTGICHLCAGSAIRTAPHQSL